MQARGIGRGALAAVLASVLGLAGCGGGGDSGNAGNTNSYATLAAWDNLFGANHAWSLYGTDGTNTYRLDISTSLLSAAVFPATGENGNRTALAASQYVNDVFDSSLTTTYFLNTSTNALIGMSDTSGQCNVVSSTTLPPTTAHVGNSGTLSTWTGYDSCAGGANQVSTGTESWLVEQTNGIVYFCEVSQVSYIDGYSAVEKDCLEMSTSGALGGAATVTSTRTDPSGNSQTSSYATQ